MSRRQALGIAVVMLMANCLLADAGAASPHVCGSAAKHLAAADPGTIARLLHDRGSPWLIEAIESLQIAPTLILVDAYLPPTSASPGLRRGKGLRLSKFLDDKEPPIAGWHVTPGEFEYAQITSPTARPQLGCDAPAGWEQPFQLKGRIPDEDIVALVQLVKSSPHRSTWTTNADGSMSLESWAVEGRNRLLLLDSTGDAEIEIHTESRPGAGQVVELQKAPGGNWVIVSVSDWWA